MEFPTVSIAIATFNSAKTLPLVLRSIEKQSYPKGKLEVIVIDGGSTDETLKISRKYHCRILRNPMIDQVFAKFLGYKKAKGDYLLLLDSDEVLKKKDSIKIKMLTMLEDERIKLISGTGYFTPFGHSAINYYINEFGDPFSHFMYGISKDARFFTKELKEKHEIVYEDNHRVVFNFSNKGDLPFIELTSMSALVNLKYIKRYFPAVLKKPALHTHIFYIINSEIGNLFAVTKNDPVIHYSVSTLKGYLKKINSRIKNNIYKTAMGGAGFTGREVYQSRIYKIKKYLFFPYSLSVIFPLIDSIFLFVERKKIIYFLHPLLCIYTVSLIVYYIILKNIGVTPKLRGYGT